MSRIEAINQYRSALKCGQKYYNARTAAHLNPYPIVLEEQTNETQSTGHVPIGTIEIPTDAIVGTLAAGRKTAFAGNFMPILAENTEFAQKWVSLCEAHLSESGIHDPITCMEFMGQFYVMEGHKRVSVLKSFGALSISATVTRMLPVWNDTPEVQAYFEFMKFYRLCGLYHMQFRRPGMYAKLQKKLGFSEDHVWTHDEKTTFLSLFWRFRSICDEKALEKVRDHSLSEALMGMLQLYPYETLLNDTSDDLQKKLAALLPDLALASDRAADPEKEQASVSMDPQVPEKSFVRSILSEFTRTTINVAFVYASSPETSAWSLGHDEGRKLLESELAEEVDIRTYVIGEGDTADSVMEKATAEGADVIFATAPTLLGAARRLSALHPACKILVCALSVPYTGVRTYYCRLYEAKFISGAIAGALCQGQPIGFIGRYPILGAPAAINAFALGARMTCPDAQVHLAWSCLPGDPGKALRQAGCRIISGQMTAAFDTNATGWSTSHLGQDGSAQVLISDVWNWGRFYIQVVRTILNGGWDKTESSASAVNYWWGMNSGVMDVQLSPTLPDGVLQLASILHDGLTRETIHPFLTRIEDQQGILRSAGDRWFTPVELMNMNWLCNNVVGQIPAQEDLLEMSRKTSSLLAIPAEGKKE